MDRQLARFGFENVAFGSNNIAQIPVLEVVINVFAHGITRDIDLKAPTACAQRAVLQRGKAGFTHHTLEHHAPSYAGCGLLACGNFCIKLFFAFAIKCSEQICGTVGWLEVIGESYGLRCPQSLELFAALGNKLVFVNGGGCCLVVRRIGNIGHGAKI